MTTPVYQIENLAHHYNGRPVLQLDALSVEKAAILGLAGPNGSGKSTLLKLLAFVDRPSKGRIRFKGKPEAPFSDGVRFQVTLLTQEPYLLKRSVFDNVAYGLRIRNGRKNFRSQVADALSMVGLDPEAFMHRSWNQLSGGEAQRVALAARLALRPEVLLLDEPTASVDGASAQMIREAALNARKEWGTTLVIASHDREWLHEVCDEVMHLVRGRPVGSGDTNILYGPWVEGSDGRWRKELSDGQRIIVPEPPSEDAALLVAPESIAIFPVTDHRTGHRQLYGIISKLHLQAGSDDLIVSTRVSDASLSVRLQQHKAKERSLYPGQNVTLTLSSTEMGWTGDGFSSHG